MMSQCDETGFTAIFTNCNPSESTKTGHLLRPASKRFCLRTAGKVAQYVGPRCCTQLFTKGFTQGEETCHHLVKNWESLATVDMQQLDKQTWNIKSFKRFQGFHVFFWDLSFCHHSQPLPLLTPSPHYRSNMFRTNSHTSGLKPPSSEATVLASASCKAVRSQRRAKRATSGTKVKQSWAWPGKLEIWWNGGVLWVVAWWHLVFPCLFPLSFCFVPTQGISLIWEVGWMN